MAPALASKLRRRDEGDRLRVYLDQSTLGELVTPDRRGLLNLLRDGVAAGLVICPAASEHRDETALAPATLYPRLEALSHELSMGVNFYEADYTAAAEVSVAAAAFVGEPRDEPMWREAFRDDPETARPFVRGVADRAPVLGLASDLLRREVEHEKSKASPITGAYAAAREAGYTFEQQVEREFEEVVYWRLGPLTNPQASRRRRPGSPSRSSRSLLREGWIPSRPGRALRRSHRRPTREARAARTWVLLRATRDTAGAQRVRSAGWWWPPPWRVDRGGPPGRESATRPALSCLLPLNEKGTRGRPRIGRDSPRRSSSGRQLGRRALPCSVN